MSRISAVISDFGGVLTTPLIDAFRAVDAHAAIPLPALGAAMWRLTERDGENPLHRLERGEIAERDFLDAVAAELSAALGRPVDMTSFSATYFEHLHPNEAMIELLRELRGRGQRMALLTNNVREWEPLWRAKAPIDELFELVVDSAFVGLRKPDREIYDLTLERLGLAAEQCLFIDDIEVNCATARGLGMPTVWFRSNEQAIAEIEAAISG